MTTECTEFQAEEIHVLKKLSRNLLQNWNACADNACDVTYPLPEKEFLNKVSALDKVTEFPVKVFQSYQVI